jgi:hypothetical protein
VQAARQTPAGVLFDINVGPTLAIAAAIAIAVVFAETVVPQVRVPDGRAYGALRGHRLVTAAIEGAVACATVGAVAVAFLYSSRVTLNAGDFLLRHPLLGAAGFAIAEATTIFVLARRARNVPSDDMGEGRGS